VIGGIDLCALQAVGIVDIERLPFGVEVDGGGSGFTVAIAGVLPASKGSWISAPIVGAFT